MSAAADQEVEFREMRVESTEYLSLEGPSRGRLAVRRSSPLHGCLCPALGRAALTPPWGAARWAEIVGQGHLHFSEKKRCHTSAVHGRKKLGVGIAGLGNRAAMTRHRHPICLVMVRRRSNQLNCHFLFSSRPYYGCINMCKYNSFTK